MGVFGRRSEGPIVTPSTTNGRDSNTIKSRFGGFGGSGSRSHGSKGPSAVSMTRKPTFGQWLKVTWLDIVTMAIMGVIGLGVSRFSSSPQSL